ALPAYIIQRTIRPFLARAEPSVGCASVGRVWTVRNLYRCFSGATRQDTSFACGRHVRAVAADAVSLTEKSGSIEPAAPRELFSISEPGTYMRPYEVSRDGQRFLVLTSKAD